MWFKRHEFTPTAPTVAGLPVSHSEETEAIVIGSNDLWIAPVPFGILRLATNNRSDFEYFPGSEIICEAPPTR